MKTPEEMAEEWANNRCPEQGPEFIVWCMCKEDFLAGYKAAQQWISVKDRLPAPQEEVLWWNKAAHQAGVSSYEYMPYCNDTMIEWGDAGNVSIKNFTHWMELPAPPKEEE